MIKHIKMMQKYLIIIYDQYFFWAGASHEELKSLVLESRRRCPSLNPVLQKEKNLPIITDWFFT